jgi:hypothetical protein
MSNNNPLADEIRQARKPRLNLTLPPRAEVPDEAVEARTREIGGRWGATTQLPTAAILGPDDPTAPLISVRFDCPDYLDTAIAVSAAEQNCTKTYLILKALKVAGYEIKDVDLVVDRRKTRRRQDREAQ